MIGIAALGAVVIGGIAWAASQKPTATPPPTPGAAPALPTTSTPVLTLTTGQAYTFAAMSTAGATDAPTLSAQLTAAGWSPNTVMSFGGPGLPYVANGTWTGATGPVPLGVIAGTP